MAVCQHEDNWFDRSICPEPCGSMHTRCSDCGETLGGCPWEDTAEERRRQHETALYEQARADILAALGAESRRRSFWSWQYRAGYAHAVAVVRDYRKEEQ